MMMMKNIVIMILCFLKQGNYTCKVHCLAYLSLQLCQADTVILENDTSSTVQQIFSITTASVPKVLVLTANLFRLLLYKVLLQWKTLPCPQEFGPCTVMLLHRVS